jgi:hypothetical protein
MLLSGRVSITWLRYVGIKVHCRRAHVDFLFRTSRDSELQLPHVRDRLISAVKPLPLNYNPPD